jgi:alkaline phosphatase D
MLGSAQKTWMESILTTPGFDAQFLVWVMPSQWMGTSSDSWDSFQTERDELVTMFGDTDWLDRMCIVSGDMHATAMDSGANNTFGGFPVFHFGSLDSAPTSQDEPFDVGPPRPGRGQYGTVQVHDSGTEVVLTATTWRGANPSDSFTTTLTPSVLSARRRGNPSHVLAL